MVDENEREDEEDGEDFESEIEAFADAITGNADGGQVQIKIVKLGEGDLEKILDFCRVQQDQIEAEGGLGHIIFRNPEVDPQILEIENRTAEEIFHTCGSGEGIKVGDEYRIVFDEEIKKICLYLDPFEIQKFRVQLKIHCRYCGEFLAVPDQHSCGGRSDS